MAVSQAHVAHVPGRSASLDLENSAAAAPAAALLPPEGGAAVPSGLQTDAVAGLPEAAVSEILHNPKRARGECSSSMHDILS